jgi:FKBP-type peptidyl-prolyl cis-trans isomerase (trigger factor)
MKVQATGTWILCEDERPKVKQESEILLLDSTVKQMKSDTERIETNILKVVSVGPLVRDENIKALKEGDMIAVDFRGQVAIMPIDRQESGFVLVVQENQIMFIVDAGDGNHIAE